MIKNKYESYNSNNWLKDDNTNINITNTNLTDSNKKAFFKKPTVEEVNKVLKQAAQGELKNIMGYEERPLVSIDYKTDPRSSIIDALSTMVVNGTQVKLYVWYDNEYGYTAQLLGLAKEMVGLTYKRYPNFS